MNLLSLNQIDDEDKLANKVQTLRKQYAFRRWHNVWIGVSMSRYQLLQRSLDHWKNEISFKKRRFNLLGNIRKIGLKAYLRNKCELNKIKMRYSPRLQLHPNRSNEFIEQTRNGQMLLLRGDKVYLSPSNQARKPSNDDLTLDMGLVNSKIDELLVKKQVSSYAQQRRDEIQTERKLRKWIDKDGTNVLFEERKPFQTTLTKNPQIDLPSIAQRTMSSSTALVNESVPIMPLRSSITERSMQRSTSRPRTNNVKVTGSRQNMFGQPKSFLASTQRRLQPRQRLSEDLIVSQFNSFLDLNSASATGATQTHRDSNDVTVTVSDEPSNIPNHDSSRFTPLNKIASIAASYLHGNFSKENIEIVSPRRSPPPHGSPISRSPSSPLNRSNRKSIQVTSSAPSSPTNRQPFEVNGSDTGPIISTGIGGGYTPKQQSKQKHFFSQSQRQRSASLNELSDSRSPPPPPPHHSPSPGITPKKVNSDEDRFFSPESPPPPPPVTSPPHRTLPTLVTDLGISEDVSDQVIKQESQSKVEENSKRGKMMGRYLDRWKHYTDHVLTINMKHYRQCEMGSRYYIQRLLKTTYRQWHRITLFRLAMLAINNEILRMKFNQFKTRISQHRSHRLKENRIIQTNNNHIKDNSYYAKNYNEIIRESLTKRKSKFNQESKHKTVILKDVEIKLLRRFIKLWYRFSVQRKRLYDEMNQCGEEYFKRECLLIGWHILYSNHIKCKLEYQKIKNNHRKRVSNHKQSNNHSNDRRRIQQIPLTEPKPNQNQSQLKIHRKYLKEHTDNQRRDSSNNLPYSKTKIIHALRRWKQNTSQGGNHQIYLKSTIYYETYCQRHYFQSWLSQMKSHQSQFEAIYKGTVYYNRILLNQAWKQFLFLYKLKYRLKLKNRQKFQMKLVQAMEKTTNKDNSSKIPNSRPNRNIKSDSIFRPTSSLSRPIGYDKKNIDRNIRKRNLKHFMTRWCKYHHHHMIFLTKIMESEQYDNQKKLKYGLKTWIQLMITQMIEKTSNLQLQSSSS